MNFFYKESRSKNKFLGGGGEAGARVSDFFNKESISKQKNPFFTGGGARGSNFFTKNPNLKKIGGGWVGEGGWSKSIFFLP